MRKLTTMVQVQELVQGTVVALGIVQDMVLAVEQVHGLDMDDRLVPGQDKVVAQVL